MTQYLMLLSESEKCMIDRERRLSAERKERRDKRDNCEHNWVCTGHSHNDVVYECKLCGKMEFN